ncbi:flagellar biosynthesis protein FlhA [Pseudovibrio exalbescens]|uniref:flagellar biosynthesis protein FlhA n=1 Tax=Pseudovibrio exalbescens TaxID=197461 RepID=UPI00236636E8|nr:flagellar biosynthesis protein FlhA [Pseudovibrio exalbescens]MDD7908996.1 flagellar biosynthesis protein FlhA [Pseudovibrio exalbescens]
MSDAVQAAGSSRRDLGFAVGIIFILSVLFLPMPTFMIDMGLAISVAFSVLILMVALWIQRPLEFSSFPTILLIATMLRLALNIATTRVILAEGHEGPLAAGYVIHGFSKFVMSGDFVIGLIVFAILVTINFLVITKGATRIAEVGARFTLDAIPGKQMAIDADLSAGMIDDKEAQRRRHELEEESSFFGAMDGASKFVRGDAVAGLIITAVNILGGIIIGVTRYNMELAEAADVFTKLSVGDGLVSQIPALIVSLAAGLLVSKGGTKGSAEQAVMGQLGGYPRALGVAAMLMLLMGLLPGLPFLPFTFLAGVLAFAAYSIPRKLEAERQKVLAAQQAVAQREAAAKRESVKDSLELAEIEVRLGKQLTARLLAAKPEIGSRINKMRKKFAEQYGFVVPEIKLTDNIDLEPKSYEFRIHGTMVAAQDIKVGELLVIGGDRDLPALPGTETREPAFGMRAMWVPKAFEHEVKRSGYTTVDNLSVVLTHLSEVIRNNLSQLLSYKDMRALIDRLDPAYKRLVDDIVPQHVSYSGLQAVLKLLLAERISIRNLSLILEAIAEIAPHARRPEQIADHVRVRMATQICGDIADDGHLKVLRLGNRWDLAFHQALRRDASGEAIEFDMEPKQVEDFAKEVSEAIRQRIAQGHRFAIVVSPEARQYVRMITERMFPALPILSHMEVARGIEVETLGTVS